MRSWSDTTIGAVAEISGGLTKNSKRNSLPLRHPYITVANVYANRLELGDVGTIGVQESELDRVLLRPGDLLVVEGNGSLSQLGRVAVWSGAIQNCLHQNHLIKVRPKTGVSSGWLLYWLLSPEGRSAIERVGSSTSGLHTLSISKVDALPVRIAPLPEQHRIVAEIEKHFTRLDDAVSTLERVQASLKQARASVLKAAVEGRLVPTEAELARVEGRTYEPASMLLERVLTERKRKYEETKGKTKYKPPVEPETEGLPTLPKGWTWVTVEQASSSQPRSIQSGPFGSSLLHSEFQAEGYLVIGIDNVLDGAFSMGAQHRISETKFAQLHKFLARPLDVLITVMATVGRCCVVPKDIEPAIITKHVYRITADHGITNPHYLMHMLNGASVVRRQMFQQAHGQTRLGLNGAIVKKLAIPLPPLAEQTRIVAEIERRFSIFDALVVTLRDNLSRCAHLRQSILKRAFSGKLVPQDPTDEPASALLARIRAESASH